VAEVRGSLIERLPHLVERDVIEIGGWDAAVEA
jgi:hypothetical protein